MQNENVTPSEVADLVGTFQTRFADLVREGRLRRYVIAASDVGSTLRPFIKSLEIYRSRHFEPQDMGERAATLADLRKSASKIALDGHIDFIIDYVIFDTTLSGLNGPITDTHQRLAFGLAKAADISTIDESNATADAVLKALHDDRKRRWSREELVTLIDDARSRFQGAAPQSDLELVVIRHETLKTADEPPTKEQLPLLVGDRRIVAVRINDIDAIQSRDIARMSAAAHALASKDGRYVRGLSRPDARTLYFGFPHVPYGVLAGFVAGQQRRVALVEHDLDSNRFEWRADAPVLGASAVGTQLSSTGVARLRVSVSARVLESACDAVLPARDLCLDLNVESSKIGRGLVGQETQAREYAARVRELLDSHVAGTQIPSLHVFAAVPVSVAFLLGQVFAHSSVPSVYVYNFEMASRPQYAWRLGLCEAARGEPCVEFVQEAGHGAA